jgi:hypothetical protein
MGRKNGNYRLKIVLLRNVLELILEIGRKRSEVNLSELHPRPLWIETFRILLNTSQRWPWQMDPLDFSGDACHLARDAPMSPACVCWTTKAMVCLANARPKWQSPARNRVIGWMPV